MALVISPIYHPFWQSHLEFESRILYRDSCWIDRIRDILNYNHSLIFYLFIYLDFFQFLNNLHNSNLLYSMQLTDVGLWDSCAYQSICQFLPKCFHGESPRSMSLARENKVPFSICNLLTLTLCWRHTFLPGCGGGGVEAWFSPLYVVNISAGGRKRPLAVGHASASAEVEPTSGVWPPPHTCVSRAVGEGGEGGGRRIFFSRKKCVRPCGLSTGEGS